MSFIDDKQFSYSIRKQKRNLLLLSPYDTNLISTHRYSSLFSSYKSIIQCRVLNTFTLHFAILLNETMKEHSLSILSLF